MTSTILENLLYTVEHGPDSSSALEQAEAILVEMEEEYEEAIRSLREDGAYAPDCSPEYLREMAVSLTERLEDEEEDLLELVDLYRLVRAGLAEEQYRVCDREGEYSQITLEELMS